MRFPVGSKYSREPLRSRLMDAVRKVRDTYRSIADVAKETGIPQTTIYRFVELNKDESLISQAPIGRTFSKRLKNKAMQRKKGPLIAVRALRDVAVDFRKTPNTNPAVLTNQVPPFPKTRHLHELYPNCFFSWVIWAQIYISFIECNCWSIALQHYFSHLQVAFTSSERTFEPWQQSVSEKECNVGDRVLGPHFNTVGL